MNRKKLALFLLAMMAAAALSPSFGEAHGKRYRYLERTGRNTDTCECLIRTDGGVTALRVSYPDGVWTISADSGYSAQNCQVTRKDRSGSILFKRDRAGIVCTGSRSTVLEARPLPWFQTPFSLAGFAKSDRSKIKFLSATLYDAGKKADNAGGSLLAMVASKEKKEPTTIGDREYPSVRVTITLPGFKSLFWKITYWYRESDGVVLRYEDVRGGPGTPKTIGTLVEETVE